MQSFDQDDLAHFVSLLRPKKKKLDLVRGGSRRGAHDHLTSLYNAIMMAEEELGDSANGAQQYTPAQLERVLEHLVDMMARGHFEGLLTPAERLELAAERAWGVILPFLVLNV